MIKKLMSLQKNLELDYGYYPAVIIERTNGDDSIAITLGDFTGEGRNVESAFCELTTKIMRYYREETDFEEEMFDFFEEIKEEINV